MDDGNKRVKGVPKPGQKSISALVTAADQVPAEHWERRETESALYRLIRSVCMRKEGWRQYLTFCYCIIY